MILFDDTKEKNKLIFLDNNDNLELFGVINSNKAYELSIISAGKNASLKATYLLLGSKNKKISFKIKSEISESGCKSDIKIISIVGENGDINIDGGIKINLGSKQAIANIEEENIFLGEHGSIKGIPSLEVASNDTKASHSLKIEKLSDEKLFYLRSKGIDKQKAILITLESLILNAFEGLKLEDEKLFNKKVFLKFRKMLSGV